jgi:hypothetical protein
MKGQHKMQPFSLLDSLHFSSRQLQRSLQKKHYFKIRRRALRGHNLSSRKTSIRLREVVCLHYRCTSERAPFVTIKLIAMPFMGALNAQICPRFGSNVHDQGMRCSAKQMCGCQLFKFAEYHTSLFCFPKRLSTQPRAATVSSDKKIKLYTAIFWLWGGNRMQIVAEICWDIFIQMSSCSEKASMTHGQIPYP